MMIKNVLVFFFLTLSSLVHADVAYLQQLSLDSTPHRGKIVLRHEGKELSRPELIFKKKALRIQIPNLLVKDTVKKIERLKKTSSRVVATLVQKTPRMSELLVQFPYQINNHKELVSLTLRNGELELSFPNLKTSHPRKAVTKKKAVSVKKQSTKKHNAKMLTAKMAREEAKKIESTVLGEDFLAELERKEKNKKEPKAVDKVARKQSSLLRTPNKEEKFSMLNYAGKFAAFLGGIIVFFLSVAHFMKKGFLKKGKLSFLNHTEEIQVVSQNYIAPKKALMIIRVQEQVFLISNTDAGINLISELKSPAQYLKTEEKNLSGKNFDDRLNLAGLDDKEQVLKENIMSSQSHASIGGRLSDQIRERVNELRPLGR